MTTSHASRATLEHLHAGAAPQVFEIGGSDFYIGHRPGLDVSLSDTRVSRDHARIYRGPDGSSQLVDLKSKNLTYVDGRKLTPFTPVRLVDGSRIRIVADEFIFHDHSCTVCEEEGHDSTVLSSLADLSSLGLSRRSIRPEAALQAILDICRSLSGGANLDEVLGRSTAS